MKKMKKGLSVVLASTLLMVPFSSMANAEVQYKVYVNGKEQNKVSLTNATLNKSCNVKDVTAWYKTYIKTNPNKSVPAPAEEKEVKPAPQPAPAPQPKPEPQPAPAPAPQQPAETGKYQAGVYEMLELINAERAKVGAAPLQLHDKLISVAQEKSEDMVRNKYFSHTSPTYGSPFDMMKTFGISYSTAGENIAINSSVAKAHTAFMGSEGHRNNILNPNYTHIGIGIAKDSGNSNSYRFTQMFIKAK